MSNFFNIINRCWLMYLAGGIIIYKMLDFNIIDLQYLESYRGAAQELIGCVPSVCSQGILKDGIRYYAHWADRFPQSMEAYNAAGYCFYHLHEYRHALDYFTHAIKDDPKNPNLYYNQALALLYLKDYHQALKSLKNGSNLFAAGVFINPYMLVPFKKELNSDVPNVPAIYYNIAIFEYGELMSLTQQIVSAASPQQKNDLMAKLHEKMERLELYYYVPIYKTSFQGKEIIML